MSLDWNVTWSLLYMFNNVFWKAETSFKVFVSRTDVRKSLLSYPAVNYPPMLVHHCCAVYASCIAEQQTSLSSDGNLPFPVSVEEVSIFFVLSFKKRCAKLCCLDLLFWKKQALCLVHYKAYLACLSLFSALTLLAIQQGTHE